MFAAALADNCALVTAAAALLGAAHRWSHTLTDEALPRLISTVVSAAVGAVAEALLLGLIGLGGTPVALAGLAVLTWLVSWWLCPVPEGTVVGELIALLGRTGWPTLAAAGAATGALAALAAMQLHRPILGEDAVTYHLPEVIGFVQSGHPGRVFNVFYGLPVGNYPLTEEVLLAWATGLSHGYSALILGTLATVPLLVLAGWLGLGELGVRAPTRALALAALVLVPLVCQAWIQPGTDLEAMAWLVCCCALCLSARRSPALLVPAILAAGLAVGTKTTVASWSVVTLACGVWFQRAALRTHWRGLLAAAVLATGTGLIWYLRNWVEHGSPLWPFSSFPGGDPRPLIIDYLATSLLQSLHATLIDHLHAYVAALSGGVVVIVGGVLTALPGVVLRRRRPIVAGVVVAAGTLEYAAGPVTGLPPHSAGVLLVVVGSTLRYLMPVFAAGAAALALLAADPHPLIRVTGWVTLAGALVWDLVSDLGAHFGLTSDHWLWSGLVVGAVTLVAVGRVLGARGSMPRARGSGTGSSTGSSARGRGWAGAGIFTGLGLGVVATVILTVGAMHFSDRYALSGDITAPVSAYLNRQPGYVDTDAPVLSSKSGMGALAGDRLQHLLAVIPQHASCSRIHRLRSHAWMVITIAAPLVRSGALARIAPAGTAGGCLSASAPGFEDGQFAVYPPLESSLRIHQNLS